MNVFSHYCLSGILLVLLAGSALAQPAPEESRGSQGSGESARPRPPEGATPEERRASYQKRAAQRAQTQAQTEEDSTPAQAGAKPGGGRPSEAQIAEWRAKPEAREDKAVPTPPAFEHQHGGEPNKAAAGGATADKMPPGKPEEAGRGSGRPDGMGMRGGMAMGMRGSGVNWLSDSPPMRGDGPPRRGIGMGGGMGGMPMGGSRGGPPLKRLWLRAGTDPVKSGFAREDAEAPAELWLVTPQGKPEGEPLPPSADGKKNLAFEMPVQGYYRLYATTRKLQGDTLNISVAKAEISNFGHGGDEDEIAKAMKAPRVLESAAIEIVREKQPNEKPFAQLKSGDEQAFVVLQKGLPLQGARVRFVSHQGWVKEAVSDEQGRVSFQVVRDYFPPWNDFQKRFKANFLVIAEANAAEAGNYKDQPYSNVRYQTTLSGSYYPASEDYRSYTWGLGVGLLIVLFCGTAVYLYRRRRVKPFQEVRFDDAK